MDQERGGAGISDSDDATRPGRAADGSPQTDAAPDGPPRHPVGADRAGGAEPTAADRSTGAGTAPNRVSRVRPPWLQYGLAAVAILVILGFIFMPRFTAPDPYEPLGDDGAPARQVADTLDATMSCTVGEISAERSVLACHEQTNDRVSMVFLQSDRAGQVASYTVETQPLSAAPDTGQAVVLANRIAAIVTPGGGFTECSHSYGNEYFCFESLASWTSADVQPVESTGAKERLPSVDDLGAELNQQGWECEYGICINGGTSMTTAQSLTGLGLQFAAPVDIDHVKQAATTLLTATDDTIALQEWAQGVDGTLSIIVANGFVVGYVPQIGGTGMVVIDEVAGVLPDTA